MVGAVKQAGLAQDEALGAVYYSYSDRFVSAMYIVVRTTGMPELLALTLQRAPQLGSSGFAIETVKEVQLITNQFSAEFGGHFYIDGDARLPHPEGLKPRAVEGGVYDPASETVTVRPFSGRADGT